MPKYLDFSFLLEHLILKCSNRNQQMELYVITQLRPVLTSTQPKPFKSWKSAQERTLSNETHYIWQSYNRKNPKYHNVQWKNITFFHKDFINIFLNVVFAFTFHFSLFFFFFFFNTWSLITFCFIIKRCDIIGISSLVWLACRQFSYNNYQFDTQGCLPNLTHATSRPQACKQSVHEKKNQHGLTKPFNKCTHIRASTSASSNFTLQNNKKYTFDYFNSLPF